MDVKANNSVYPILIMAQEDGVAGVEMTGHIGYGEDKRGKAVKRYNGELNGATLFPKWQASPHAVVKKAVTDAGFDPADFDLTGAAEALSKADVLEDEDPSETKEAAAMLVSANDAATAFATGEATARGALYDLSVIIAKAIETMGDSFDKWLAQGNPALHEQFSSEVSANAKSEFLAVGRLPRDYFDAMPPRTMTPKAVQYNFNVDKALIAERIAGTAYANFEDMGYCDNAVSDALRKVETLSETDLVSDANPMSKARRQIILMKGMIGHIKAATEGFTVSAMAVSESDGAVTFTAAKSGTDYVVPAQFAVRAREHELIAAIRKELETAVKVSTPEEKAQEERKKAAQDVAKADFVDISASHAAAHLARILQARSGRTDADGNAAPDCTTVYNMLGDILDRADEAGWQNAIAEAMTSALAAETEAKDAADASAADDAANDAA